MRLGTLYKCAKVQPDRLNGENFLVKKLEIPLAPMVNRESLERSRLQSTPPQPSETKTDVVHIALLLQSCYCYQRVLAYWEVHHHARQVQCYSQV